MTVRELINLLQAIPESEQDAPIYKYNSVDGFAKITEICCISRESENHRGVVEECWWI